MASRADASRVASFVTSSEIVNSFSINRAELLTQRTKEAKNAMETPDRRGRIFQVLQPSRTTGVSTCMRLLPALITASLTFVATRARCATNTAETTTAPELVQEIVEVKYARATDIAGLFNSFGTSPPPLTRYSGAAREVISNAWTRLSDRFKETNSRRDNSSAQAIVSGEDRIIADERSNSLLLSGATEDVTILKEAISTLDVVAPQVLVEGVVLEVTLPDAPGASGLSWLRDWLQARKGFSAEPSGPTPATNGTEQMIRFSSLPHTNGSIACSKCFSQITDLNDDLDDLLRELADTRARILARPRIQTSVGEPATFFVGKARPYPSATMGSYTCASSIQQLEIGADLEVTITLNDDKSLQCQIHQVSEETNGVVEIANVGSVDITQRHESQAELSMGNGKTIVVGGVSEPGSKGQRQHVLVLLRPTLLPPPDSVAAVRRKL